MSIVYLLLSFLACYFICSVNFAVIISKLFAKEDIRTKGSGNAGMTNMMRSVGVVAGGATLVLDVLKGIGAMLLCSEILLPLTNISADYIRYCVIYLCAFFCILGHDFPLYFGFKGGKGIASALGIILIIDWRVALFCLVAFITMVIFCRIVSISSVTSAVLVSMTTFLINTMEKGIYFGILSTLCISVSVALVIYMHRTNIQKLIKGEEKQLKLKK